MKKVLVVDDSQTILTSLKHELDKDKSIDAIYVKTYKEAEEILSADAKNIHAALLDLHLPDAPNGEVISLANNYDIPTVVLTGSMNKSVRQTIQKKDIVAYILKERRTSARVAVKFIQRILKNYDTTIMVVDDSIVYRKALTQSLKKINIKVLEASDGQEALDILKSSKEKISIIITDYEMPKLNGLDLTIKIREEYSKDQLGIIAISSDDDKDMISDFLKFGANDFVNKPFTAYEVIMRINANLELLDIFEQFSDMANRDYMTGSYNRRYFFDSGNAIVLKSMRKSASIAVATIDIDNFKKINDTYGHDVGDVAIKAIKTILDSNLRESDLVARFGGEEYCILLEDISLDDTKTLFEKIRKSFEANIMNIKGTQINYTVSFGIAYGGFNSLEDMVKFSDEALYKAKENGRNQVVIKEIN